LTLQYFLTLPLFHFLTAQTVQTISVLSALLKKTGTGIDMYELCRRKKIIQQKVVHIAKEKEKALLDGRIFMEAKELESLKQELKLPEWSPILIFAPNSVVVNWERDFKTWGYFSVALYQGIGRDKALESVENGMTEVLVCAHSMLQGTNDFGYLIGSKVKWKIVVMDEFHLLKNDKSQMAQNLKKLRDDHGSVIFGLTGTLMQNKHKELWVLIDLTRPEYLGEWNSFSVEYSKPIMLSRWARLIVKTRSIVFPIEEH
jgi:DNA excision repair protein ERCC-6-like 2